MGNANSSSNNIEQTYHPSHRRRDFVEKYKTNICQTLPLPTPPPARVPAPVKVLPNFKQNQLRLRTTANGVTLHANGTIRNKSNDSQQPPKMERAQTLLHFDYNSYAANDARNKNVSTNVCNILPKPPNPSLQKADNKYKSKKRRAPAAPTLKNRVEDTTKVSSTPNYISDNKKELTALPLYRREKSFDDLLLRKSNHSNLSNNSHKSAAIILNNRKSTPPVVMSIQKEREKKPTLNTENTKIPIPTQRSFYFGMNLISNNDNPNQNSNSNSKGTPKTSSPFSQDKKFGQNLSTTAIIYNNISCGEIERKEDNGLFVERRPILPRRSHLELSNFNTASAWRTLIKIKAKPKPINTNLFLENERREKPIQLVTANNNNYNHQLNNKSNKNIWTPLLDLVNDAAKEEDNFEFDDEDEDDDDELSHEGFMKSVNVISPQFRHSLIFQNEIYNSTTTTTSSNFYNSRLLSFSLPRDKVREMPLGFKSATFDKCDKSKNTKFYSRISTPHKNDKETRLDDNWVLFKNESKCVVGGKVGNNCADIMNKYELLSLVKLGSSHVMCFPVEEPEMVMPNNGMNNLKKPLHSHNSSGGDGGAIVKINNRNNNDKRLPQQDKHKDEDKNQFRQQQDVTVAMQEVEKDIKRKRDVEKARVQQQLQKIFQDIKSDTQIRLEPDGATDVEDDNEYKELNMSSKKSNNNDNRSLDYNFKRSELLLEPYLRSVIK